VAFSRNFRGAGGRSDQCSVKAWVNKKKIKSTKKQSHWRELFVAASSRQTVLITGKHAWKSLSWWTVGPVTGRQMNIKFGCRHAFWFGRANKLELMCPQTCHQFWQRCSEIINGQCNINVWLSRPVKLCKLLDSWWSYRLLVSHYFWLCLSMQV